MGRVLFHRAILYLDRGATFWPASKRTVLIAAPAVRTREIIFGIFITVKRNFYWIWFVGAGVWFFDAALSLHVRSIRGGVLETLIAAAFLGMGMYLRKQRSR